MLNLSPFEPVHIGSIHTALFGRQTEIPDHVVERAILLQENDDVIDIRQSIRECVVPASRPAPR